MKNLMKLLVGLLVALPMVAYVAHTLIASQQPTDHIQALVVQTGEGAQSSGTQPPAPARRSQETLEIRPHPQDLISPAPLLPLRTDDQDDSGTNQTPPSPGSDNSANGTGSGDRGGRDRDADEDPDDSGDSDKEEDDDKPDEDDPDDKDDKEPEPSDDDGGR